MVISYVPLDVCSRFYENFAVLYDLRNRQILELESVSADVWSYIVSHQDTSLPDITTYISSIYECEENEVEDDIIDFLQDLYDSGIIQFNHNYASEELVSSSANESATETDDAEGLIIQELEEEDQLYSATIEMTYACNEKCIHCYAHYPNGDFSNSLSLHQYKTFIDQLYEMGTLHLSFTGGDPFMNPNFYDVFSYARHKGFVCDIFTNGLYLAANISILDNILELRPRAFYISIYGSNSKVHDMVTATPGSFEKTINAVKKIRASGTPVVFNVMLLSVNSGELEDIIALAKSLDVEYRVSMSLIYRNDGDSAPMNYFIADKGTLKAILKLTNKRTYSIDRPSISQQDSPFLCGAGVTSLCLSPNGTVNPCVSLKVSLGHISKDSVRDIWTGIARKELIDALRWENTAECKSCSLRKFCPHCAGISQAETGNMFSCNVCDRIIAECVGEIS